MKGLGKKIFGEKIKVILGHNTYGAEGRETVSKKMLRCPAEQLVDGDADFEPGNTKRSRFTRSTVHFQTRGEFI